MTSKNVPNILLIEDDESDIELFKMALAKSPIVHKLVVVRDAKQAIAALNQKPPDLIFMDVNLPGKIGMVLLREVKSHNEYKSIPVIMLSTSSTPASISEAYQNQANAYLVKPIDYRDLSNALVKTLEFWLQIASMPPAA